MVRPAHTFMSFGIPGYVRCEKPPVYIATERKANKDGQKGSMSLCEEHAAEMVKRLGKDRAVLKHIVYVKCQSCKGKGKVSRCKCS